MNLHGTKIQTYSIPEKPEQKVLCLDFVGEDGKEHRAVFTFLVIHEEYILKTFRRLSAIPLSQAKPEELQPQEAAPGSKDSEEGEPAAPGEGEEKTE